MNIKKLCQCAVLMALVFVVTRFIQVPIPNGYFNIGNTVILIGCTLMPMWYGVAIGSLPSALADLTSYPIYTIPTLIIKALMPLVFYLIRGKEEASFVRTMVAATVSTLIPLFGYTLVGCFFTETFIAGLAQFPGLALEYAANLVLFGILHKLIQQSGIKRYL